jgi:tetratricopeptide (TPR) repeat protein/predicted Zn-dependent protease
MTTLLGNWTRQLTGSNTPTWTLSRHHLVTLLSVFGLLALLSGLVLPSLSSAYAASPCASQYQTGYAYYRQGAFNKAMEVWRLLLQSQEACEEKVYSIFYIGIIFEKSGNTDEARKLFERVIEMAPPNSNLAVAADQHLQRLTERQMVQNGQDEHTIRLVQWSQQQTKTPNYLSHVLEGGRVTHWDLNRMPLRIFVADGSKIPGWKPNHTHVIAQAAGLWERASGGALRFVLVPQDKDADIIVRWTNAFSKHTPGRVGEHYYKIIGSTIINSEIKLSTALEGGKGFLTDEMLLQVAAHELGHALGLQGHSPYANDLMYWQMNPKQTGRLSLRDVNTIRLLYHLGADVQNNVALPGEKGQNVYALLEKAQSALQKQDYTTALKLFQQLAAIPDVPGRYGVMHNLALLQAKMGDLDGSLQSVAEAVELNPTFTASLHLFSVLLFEKANRHLKAGEALQARQLLSKAHGLIDKAIVTYPKNSGPSNELPPRQKLLELQQSVQTLLTHLQQAS